MRGLFMTAAAVIAAIAVSGCGPTASDLPIPGSGVGGPSYHLTADFTDALNLPMAAKVKLDGVDIGRVTSMDADGFQARVGLAILASYPLPVGTSLTLRQETPLGEMYVAVTAPSTPNAAMLRDGDTLTPAVTHQSASVEDTLAAISTITNGGGIGQLSTIVQEANLALSGQGGNLHELLSQLDLVVGTLNARSASITQLLASAAHLTGVVRDNDKTISDALTTFAPATKILANQTQQLVTLVGTVDNLSRSGTTFLGQSRADLQRLVSTLGPALEGYSALDQDLGPVLQKFSAFSSTVQAILPSDAGVGSLQLAGLVPDATPGGIPGVAGTPLPGIPSLPSLPGVPGLPQIPLLPSLGLGGSTASPSAGGSPAPTGLGAVVNGLLGGGGTP